MTAEKKFQIFKEMYGHPDTGSSKNLSWIHSSPRLIIVKMSKVEDERILKTARAKNIIICKRTHIRLRLNENLRGHQKTGCYIRSLERRGKKKTQKPSLLRILHPAKLSFTNKREIKSLSPVSRNQGNSSPLDQPYKKCLGESCIRKKTITNMKTQKCTKLTRTDTQKGNKIKPQHKKVPNNEDNEEVERNKDTK